MPYPSLTEYCDLYSLTLTRYEENQEYFISVCSGSPFFTETVHECVLQEYPHARLVKREDTLLEFNLGTAFDLIKNTGKPGFPIQRNWPNPCNEVGITSSMPCAIAPSSEEENQ